MRWETLSLNSYNLNKNNFCTTFTTFSYMYHDQIIIGLLAFVLFELCLTKMRRNLVAIFRRLVNDSIQQIQESKTSFKNAFVFLKKVFYYKTGRLQHFLLNIISIDGKHVQSLFIHLRGIIKFKLSTMLIPP